MMVFGNCDTNFNKLITRVLFIHRPYADWSMAAVRQWHFVFMYIFLITFIARVYWAMFGSGSSSHGSRTKQRDGRWFVPEKQNRGKFFETIKYYLFVKKHHPGTSKFNPLQKSTYVFWGFLIVAQAITGFAIYTPTAKYLAPITIAAGGLVNMRVIHFLIMALFVITTAIHVYLAIAEDYGAFVLMFTGKEVGKRSTSEARQPSGS